MGKIYQEARISVPVMEVNAVFYTFLVSGFAPERREGRIALGQFKNQAIHAACRLRDSNERLGPLLSFEREGGWRYERSLTKSELVFGVYTSLSTKFDGLVTWAGYEALGCLPEIKINLDLCRFYGVSADNIFDFVRRIIIAAGWTILKEEEESPRRKRVMEIDD